MNRKIFSKIQLNTFLKENEDDMTVIHSDVDKLTNEEGIVDHTLDSSVINILNKVEVILLDAKFDILSPED